MNSGAKWGEDLRIVAERAISRAWGSAQRGGVHIDRDVASGQPAGFESGQRAVNSVAQPTAGPRLDKDLDAMFPASAGERRRRRSEDAQEPPPAFARSPASASAWHWAAASEGRATTRTARWVNGGYCSSRR